MANNVGTYDISFLLAAKDQSVKQVGVETVTSVLEADLAMYNSLVGGMLSDLCDITEDERRYFGVSSGNEMIEVDEFGVGASQRVNNPYSIYFPIKKFTFASGWTKDFMARATAADVAQKMLDAQTAHKLTLQSEIRKAIFRKTNVTFRDYLTDNVSSLTQFRFLNGDGNSIPMGAAGESFNGTTHLHYLSSGTATVADALATINTVVEHGHGGNVVMAINRANEATVKAYSGFSALQPAWLINPMYAAASGVPAQALDTGKVDNRQIGFLGAAEVWVKSWVPSGYWFVWDKSDTRKPLGCRVPKGGSPGLIPVGEFMSHFLSTQVFESHFGFGAWTRTNGAVFYTGNDVWSDGV
jgi:hypothetical protein